MTKAPRWVNDANAAGLTDLYQLTMLQAYHEEGMEEDATFDLFVRRLPPERNFLIACGLDDLLRYLETFSFPQETLAYLASLPQFTPRFVEWLEGLRFRGDVYAMAEGTPVFPGEPLVEVVAPIPEAQLIESFALNQVNFQTVMASKGARVVASARGRTVVDFGMRRMHGTDAAIKAARAFYVGGVHATSNVLAGQMHGIPVAGTVAHSYIEAHDDEMDAFRAFAHVHPDTVLLVDTYDTLAGVQKVVELARELGDDFRVRAVRLDSGDLVQLSKGARRILDGAGLSGVGIFASGGLDDASIDELLSRGAPIDGFGVGSAMAVSSDAPVLDSVYKLVEYAGSGRMKLSEHKATLPGRKQVFRVGRGEDARDVIALQDESHDGRPLLRKVMERGARLDAGREELEEARSRARWEIGGLPSRLWGLGSADPPFDVSLSPGLQGERDRIRSRLTARPSAAT